MGFFGFGKKPQAPTPTSPSPYADKIRLVKNSHKYYGIIPWGMSFLVEQEGQPLREARWMIRNQEEQNGFVNVLLAKATGNVIGSRGFQLQSLTCDHDFNKQIEKLWQQFTRQADSVGNTWVRHQSLGIRGVFRDGDGGCVNLYTLINPDTGQPFKIDKIAPFEATDLQTPPNQQPHQEGSRIVDGIEYDALGRPTHYYIRTMAGMGAIEAKHVAMFSNVQKSSNSRGLPSLMPCIGMLENINGLVDAEIYASRLNATTVYHQHHAKAIAKSPTTDPNTQSPGVTPPAPGEVVHTYGEDKFEVFSPNHPNQNFKEAFVLFARIIASNLYLPVEQVLNYWGETNYSSSRASLLDTQRSFEAFQNEYAHAYLSRVYKWKVLQWIDDGKLAIPTDVEVDDVFEHRFVGAKFPLLDPQKEIQGHQLAIDVGIETRRSLLAARGIDYDTWIAERSDEIKREKDAGIPQLHHNSMQQVDKPEDRQPGDRPLDLPEPKEDAEGDE